MPLTNGVNALTNRGYDRLGILLINAFYFIVVTNKP
jgi:hypothetical protein